MPAKSPGLARLSFQGKGHEHPTGAGDIGRDSHEERGIEKAGNQKQGPGSECDRIPGFSSPALQPWEQRKQGGRSGALCLPSVPGNAAGFPPARGTRGDDNKHGGGC